MELHNNKNQPWNCSFITLLKAVCCSTRPCTWKHIKSTWSNFKHKDQKASKVTLSLNYSILIKPQKLPPSTWMATSLPHHRRNHRCEPQKLVKIFEKWLQYCSIINYYYNNAQDIKLFAVLPVVLSFPNSAPKLGNFFVIFTFMYDKTWHKNVIMFMCLVTHQTNHGAQSDPSAEWALKQPPLSSLATTYRD